MSTQCDGCPECAPLRARLAEKEQEILDLTESLTRHDTLTGALNRRALTELVAEELQRSSRTGQPFCVAMIGIDHLKDVNLQFGHDTGDAVIVEVARRLVANSRSADAVARLGGDEFVVVCEHTTPAEARMIAERIVGAIDQPIDARGVVVRVTSSCGIVTADAAVTGSLLLEAADAAMYRAKAEGKNRVAV